ISSPGLCTAYTFMVTHPRLADLSGTQERGHPTGEVINHSFVDSVCRFDHQKTIWINHVNLPMFLPPSKLLVTPRSVGFQAKKKQADTMFSPLFKPRECASHVGHVQYRSQSFGFHSGSRITLWAIESWLTFCKISFTLKCMVRRLTARGLKLSEATVCVNVSG